MSDDGCSVAREGDGHEDMEEREESYEDAYVAEEEEADGVHATAVKTKRAGIEVEADGEPIMLTELDDAVTEGRKFDTAESALMSEYQKTAPDRRPPMCELRRPRRTSPTRRTATTTTSS